MKSGGQFPDPGKVPTSIVYQNQTYSWPAGGKPPRIFDNVSAGWDNFAGGFTPIIANLADPTKFHEVRQAWQELVYLPNTPGPERSYSAISFYQGLVEAFVENADKYGCAPWTEDDFSLFGALGLGSGGFGPLYSVNFAEIIRLIVNGLETDQQFYPGGLDAFINGFVNRLKIGGKATVRLQSRVSGVKSLGSTRTGGQVPSALLPRPFGAEPRPAAKPRTTRVAT